MTSTLTMTSCATLSILCAPCGKETLEQNLAFIAEALGGRGTSREVIRTYFLKDFFKDHCQTL